MEPIAVPAGMQLVCKATGEFYLSEKFADAAVIFGPRNADQRYLRVRSELYDRTFEVLHQEGVVVEFELSHCPRVEPGGGDPVSVPLEMLRAETLSEEIARVVKQEMLRQADDDPGSDVDEDDFDVDDEDPVGKSGYEVTDMELEEPVTPPAPPVDKTAPSAGAKLTGGTPNGSSQPGSAPVAPAAQSDRSGSAPSSVHVDSRSVAVSDPNAQP